MRNAVSLFLVALVASCIVITNARAQWLTQSLDLVPGWNAVYLEVQPYPDWTDNVFSNTPVQSVWKWTRRFTTIQFEKDPSETTVQDPHWQVWFPPDSSNRYATRLPQIEGGRAYLVHVPTNASAFTLRVKGRVIMPIPEWYPHSLNLIGLNVDSNQAPTFADYFAYTPAIRTDQGSRNALYTLLPSGKSETIVQPARVAPKKGAAYWIQCARTPAATSPLVAEPDTGTGLDFGSSKNRETLRIQNLWTNRSMTVTVRLRDSETPPTDAGMPSLAGAVPLSYLVKTNNDGVWHWYTFPDQGLTQTVAPGGEWDLYLGVRRDDMTTTDTNAEYQSILDVKETFCGLLIRVPVSAGTDLTSTNGEIYEKQGLWVGDAVIGSVNAPAYSGTNLLTAPSDCKIRLIFHIGSDQKMKLLQRVMLAWDDTLTDPPHTNGTYALFASETNLPSNAKEVTEISSVAFPLMPPINMEEVIAVEESAITNMGGTDSILDQQNNNFGYHANETTPWQSFTPGYDGNLTALQTWIYAADGSNTWTANLIIREGRGLNGTKLGSQYVTCGGAVQQQTIYFTNGPTLQAGCEYSFCFENSSVQLRGSLSSNLYSGGTCFNSGYDYNFTTYITVPVIKDTTAAQFTIGPNDPLNPYLHRYHPSFDNKDWSFETYTNAVEVPSITRSIRIRFLELDSAVSADPLWGEEQMVGIYSETITGLRAQPINLEGPFAIKRVSKIGTLK